MLVFGFTWKNIQQSIDVFTGIKKIEGWDYLFNTGIFYSLIIQTLNKINLDWKLKTTFRTIAFSSTVYLLHNPNSMVYWRNLVVRILF